MASAVFSFDGMAGYQREYVTWLLEARLRKGDGMSREKLLLIGVWLGTKAGIIRRWRTNEMAVQFLVSSGGHMVPVSDYDRGVPGYGPFAGTGRGKRPDMVPPAANSPGARDVCTAVSITVRAGRFRQGRGRAP